jgi:benzoyl-CoA reductase/2-hydroxyglutaryl-CoA dehydratase subunit BcrC/BadD/HgdB
MNYKYITLAIAAAVLSTSVFGAEPFRRQSKINDAHKELKAAQAQVEKSRLSDDRRKNLEKAWENLNSAKASLEEAKKNKGSYRPAAIRAIDKAKVELDAAVTNPARAAKATEFIKEAIEQTIKAGEAGRR